MIKTFKNGVFLGDGIKVTTLLADWVMLTHAVSVREA
jgi:hypothetical protein